MDRKLEALVAVVFFVAVIVAAYGLGLVVCKLLLRLTGGG